MQPEMIAVLLLAIVLGVGLIGLWSMLKTQTQTNARLQRRVQDLEAAKLLPTEGAKGEWAVQVGGRSVPIRALTTEQWALAMGELPQWLFSYVLARGKSANANDPKQLAEMSQMAQRWVLACAVGEPPDISRMTVPESLEALTTISRLNGVDMALRELLRQRLDPSTTGQRSDTVQPTTQRTTRSN
jgi:hypothetical protein